VTLADLRVVGVLSVLGLVGGDAYAWGKGSVQMTRATALGLPENAPDARTKTVLPSPVPTTLSAAHPMPTSPKPSWVLCPENCGYGKLKPCEYKGHPREDWVGLQGICWALYPNQGWNADPKQRKPCDGEYEYDPPDYVPKELQRYCYVPLIERGRQPNALKPSQGVVGNAREGG